jgi:hypothetical protein
LIATFPLNDEEKGGLAFIWPNLRKSPPPTLLTPKEANYVNGIDLSVDGGFTQV